jgi:hypothetical protein
VASPDCDCGGGRDTVLHLITEYRDITTQRQDLRKALGSAIPTNRSSLTEATKSGTTGGELVHWLLKLGRLREFRLAIRLVIRLAQDNSPDKDVKREAAMHGSVIAGSRG